MKQGLSVPRDRGADSPDHAGIANASPLFGEQASSKDLSGRQPGASTPWLAACAGLAVFAFSLNWVTGHRGIFLLDQSMIFDGAWRIIQGQVPYKDFFFPFGPLSFYIQAVFFYLFGVNWSATVLSACVVSVLATLSTVRIIRLLLGGRKWLAIAGGLGTAVCFQAPFGTLWLEQTSLFFDLLALQAVVEALSAAGRRRIFWQIASGSLSVLAILSKQNFGAFFIPVTLLILTAGEVPRARKVVSSVLSWASGAAVTVGLFVCWVWLYSDFASFIRSAIGDAGAIGRSRMNAWTVTTALFLGAVPNTYQVDLVAVLFGGAGLLFALANIRNRFWSEFGPASVCCLLLPWFRSMTQMFTLNEWENNLGLAALAAAVGLGLALKLIELGWMPLGRNNIGFRIPSARTLSILLLTGTALWAGIMLEHEFKAGLDRRVQQFAANTGFGERMQSKGLRHVRWGEPTPINPKTVLKREELDNLVSYLTSRREHFFVMGDSTLLYGLTGMPSPQPLLYYGEGHSFRTSNADQLDQLVVNDLKRNDVRLVVRERETFDPKVAFGLFARTQTWFKSQFRLVTEFGIYEVWERTDREVPTSSGEVRRGKN